MIGFFNSGTTIMIRPSHCATLVAIPMPNNPKPVFANTKSSIISDTATVTREIVMFFVLPSACAIGVNTAFRVKAGTPKERPIKYLLRQQKDLQRYPLHQKGER